MKKRIMSAVLCVVFVLCFAFPALAASSSVDKHVNLSGGISIHYYGHACNGNCYIGESIGFSNPSFTIPESDCYGSINLELQGTSLLQFKVISKTGYGYSLGKWGSIGFEPIDHLYQFSIAGDYYEEHKQF